MGGSQKLTSTCMMLLGAMLMITIVAPPSLVEANGGGDLRVGFYRSRCPNAELIVRETVANAIGRNRGIGAGLLRMHFHDCFVRGCDASVLLDSTPGKTAEKDSIPNKSLRGFEAIDEAKARLEAACPRTVSCSDILAFAARDSADLLGKIWYEVPSGRRDGRVSTDDEALENLPPAFSDVPKLKEAFARKGLSLGEMVTLSGAHSIGVAHCSSFEDRLYTNPTDPTMDPRYAAFLKSKCPRDSNGDNTVDFDFVSPNRLDNKYYRNLNKNAGLLTSDQVLSNDPSTSQSVWRHANNDRQWAAEFAAAMIKMGRVQVITGQNGEVRTKCRLVN